MRVEHLLDLARVDVVTAADDQLLLAVDEEQIPVLVDPPEVSGREPALGVERLRRRLRVVPVAGDHGRAAELYLPDAAFVRVVETHLGRAERHADRAGLPLLAVGVRRRDAATAR